LRCPARSLGCSTYSQRCGAKGKTPFMSHAVIRTPRVPDPSRKRGSESVGSSFGDSPRPCDGL
jgi:hypothetical protein